MATGYSTPNDLRLVLARDRSQLGPGVGTGTAADLSDAQLADAIATASADIDSTLYHRFSVPFPSPFPALVVAVCKGLAAWHANAIMLESTDIAPNDPTQRRFEWAMDRLAKLSSGALDLPDVGPSTSTSAAMLTFPAYSGVLFSPDNFGIDYEQTNLWYGAPSGTWP